MNDDDIEAAVERIVQAGYSIASLRNVARAELQRFATRTLAEQARRHAKIHSATEPELAAWLRDLAEGERREGRAA